MAKVKLRMAIDPFKVLDRIAEKVGGKLVGKKVISMDYDEEADILYIQFKLDKEVDNEALDEEGYIIGKLNKKGEIIGLTIIDASQTKPKTSTT